MLVCVLLASKKFAHWLQTCFNCFVHQTEGKNPEDSQWVDGLVGWWVGRIADWFFRHESQGESSELRGQGNSPAYLCGLVSVSQTKRNETNGIKTHWKFAYENEIQIGFPCPSQSVPASPITKKVNENFRFSPAA